MAPSFITCLALLAAGAFAAPASSPAEARHLPLAERSLHQVAGVGTFENYASYDFTKLNSLPAGLSYSTDSIAGSGSARAQKYLSNNVYVRNGALNLKVPGGQQGASTIQGAQIFTDAHYQCASVRTVAKVSKVGGTCSGFFSYNNDNLEESDIEILTSNMTAIHYTNQNPAFQTSGTGPRSQTRDGAIPSDATEKFHEYRLDWVPGKVRFFLDGKQQTELDQFVPKAATPWVWNNWSNGDDGWSAGPPTADNILQIQKIEVYYNTTGAN